MKTVFVFFDDHYQLTSLNISLSLVADFLRTCVSSRHIFQELNTLLARLGSPNYRRSRTLASSTLTPSSTSSSTAGPRSSLLSSQLEEFLDGMSMECDEKMLRSIRAREVFYKGGRSKAGNEVYYYVARRFR